MMEQRKFSWMCLLRAEDSTTETRDCLTQINATRLIRTGKALLWLGLSVLMGIGVSQLD